MTKITVFLLLLLAVAVITDSRYGKIPNWLIVIGLLVGIWVAEERLEKIAVAVLIILIFYPLFTIGALGAGDIKCIAMISLYLKTEQILATLFFIFLTAAIFSVGKIFYHHSLEQIKSKIHLALPILVGVLISIGGTYL